MTRPHDATTDIMGEAHLPMLNDQKDVVSVAASAFEKQDIVPDSKLGKPVASFEIVQQWHSQPRKRSRGPDGTLAVVTGKGFRELTFLLPAYPHDTGFGSS
ncbi:hypothetical protein FDECE_10365 [Fusarium decemcellulare]|nr:hypothetical protein FDECE_10365 [Fusarium decemcellulare]